MNTDVNEIHEIDALKKSMDTILWIWAWFHYREEGTVDVFHRDTGCELLAIDTAFTVEGLLSHIKQHWKTLQLFQRWLLEAFSRISEWEKGDISVNAYIGDIGNEAFCAAIEEIMLRFKAKDRLYIVIEIIETPYGDINGRFIDNVIWLRDQWFRLAIDDYDLFAEEDDNVSEEVLKTVWQYCAKIKLDWRVTRKLIEQSLAQRQLLDLRSAYPDKIIVAEWIHTRADMHALTGIVDIFQFSSYGTISQES